MGRHHASTGGGRLHGRLLQLLGAVSAVSALVAVVALWQFGVFGGDDREPVSTIEGPETAWGSEDGEERSGAPGPAPSASSAPVSPTESTQEPTTAEPSETSASPTPAASTTSAAEEEAGRATCAATLTLKNEWGDRVEVSVEVVNTGDVTLTSWSIDLDIDDLDIDNHWNMQEVRHGWYGSVGWNSGLDADENAVVGFQGDVGDDFDLPSSVTCKAQA